MSNTITFVTSNKGKLDWLRRILANDVRLNDWMVEGVNLDLIEIQSSDVAEISMSKAKQAFAQIKKPVLVMDGGFYIEEWNGFPGPFGKYMFEQIGIDGIAKIIRTLENKRCGFKNVATFASDQGFRQFSDTTQDIFTLTDTPWPHDHPQQWSIMWRVLVPSGLGYDKPLAAMSDEELNDYMEKRRNFDTKSSCLNDFVQSLSAEQQS